MAKNLFSLGTKLLKILLLSGAALSLVGIFCVTRHPHAVVYILGFNLVSFVAVFWIMAARKLVKRVKRLASAMDSAAEGNLTVKVHDDGLDELGMLNSNFNGMLERLSGIVDSVQAATRELRSIGGKVGNVAQRNVSIAERQSVSSRAAKDAALEIRQSVEEVSRSVDGLSSSAAENSVSIGEISSSISEINQHIDSLAQAIEQVHNAISDMTNAQKEINVSVNNLMDTSSRTARLVGEMDSSVRNIEYSAKQTASISDNVLRDARLGKESVETTISGIGEIRSASQTVNRVIETLSEKAANIGTILQVIDEIAERTKLLALNASIIAAQAGVHGKGFAVVADEIKTLARRTTNSTREIAGIVTGVQVETEKAVEAIRFSEEKVLEGERLSFSSGEALDKILDGVIKATAQINDIARAAVNHTEQSDSMRNEIESIATMVEQILKATDAQTCNTELITEAAKGMQRLASDVRDLAWANDQAGTSIVNSSAAVIKMIEEIRQACQFQNRSSEAIVETAEEMAEFTSGNLEMTRVMGEAVAGLTSQIQTLEKEMSGLRTAAASGA